MYTGSNRISLIIKVLLLELLHFPALSGVAVILAKFLIQQRSIAQNATRNTNVQFDGYIW